MFPEKSCISLKGKHTALRTPNTQRRSNVPIIPAARKRDHNINSNEEGVFKCNFQIASSLAFPLLAAALVSQPTSVLASELTLDSKVALKRDVVEDMLIQRFKNRIHGVSDEELAQITERLLAEQASFPTDLLLISPSPRQQQQQRPRQQAPPAPTPKVTMDPTVTGELDQDEEDDDTAELFATLGDVATEGAAGAAASTVSDAITNNWAPQIPRIAKAVGIGAGLAATVPAGAALQRRMSKKSGGGSGGGSSGNTTENINKNSQATETEKKESGGIGRFMSWLFGDDVPETQPETMNSVSAAANQISSSSSDASNSGTAAPSEQEEAEASSSYVGDQVLWRKKDDADIQPSFAPNGSSTRGNTSISSGAAAAGGVLWRRNEKVEEEDKMSNGPSNQQQDLWRVPIESLRSPANGEDAAERPQVSQRKKPLAPSPRPVPVVEKKKVVDGSSAGAARVPKLSESALDNAEPPDFVANGVHKL